MLNNSAAWLRPGRKGDEPVSRGPRTISTNYARISEEKSKSAPCSSPSALETAHLLLSPLPALHCVGFLEARCVLLSYAQASTSLKGERKVKVRGVNKCGGKDMLRPGFEPGSRARKARMLDRATPPERQTAVERDKETFKLVEEQYGI